MWKSFSKVTLSYNYTSFFLLRSTRNFCDLGQKAYSWKFRAIESDARPQGNRGCEPLNSFDIKILLKWLRHNITNITNLFCDYKNYKDFSERNRRENYFLNHLKQSIIFMEPNGSSALQWKSSTLRCPQL